MRKAELLRRIEALEKRMGAVESRRDPMWEPMREAQSVGCKVCGISGIVGYVCSRMDCPSRVWATSVGSLTV